MIEYRLEVDAPVKFLWEALTDYEKLPIFLKDLKKIEVRKAEGNKKVVWHEIEIIKPVWYILEYCEDELYRKISWNLVDCGKIKLPIPLMKEFKFMEKDTGSYTFSEPAPDKCVADYRIEVKLASMIPGKITQMVTEANLPKMMNSYKARAEELYAASKNRS